MQAVCRSHLRCSSWRHQQEGAAGTRVDYHESFVHYFAKKIAKRNPGKPTVALGSAGAHALN